MPVINRILALLYLIVANGIEALIGAIPITFVLYLLLALASLPVDIIFGVNFSISNKSGDMMYRVVYTVLFLSLMADDLGVPNLKTAFKKWWKQRKTS